MPRHPDSQTASYRATKMTATIAQSRVRTGTRITRDTGQPATVLPADRLASLPVIPRDAIAAQTRSDERVIACVPDGSALAFYIMRAAGMGRPSHTGVRVLRMIPAPSVVSGQLVTTGDVWQIESDTFMFETGPRSDVSARTGPVTGPLPSGAPNRGNGSQVRSYVPTQPSQPDRDAGLAALRRIASRTQTA